MKTKLLSIQKIIEMVENGFKINDKWKEKKLNINNNKKMNYLTLINQYYFIYVMTLLKVHMQSHTHVLLKGWITYINMHSYIISNNNKKITAFKK